MGDEFSDELRRLGFDRNVLMSVVGYGRYDKKR